MDTNEVERYWIERGENSFKYKGEEFYTITPISYYYQRRKELLSTVFNFVKEYNVDQTSKILDFGCGDGWYLNYFARKMSSNFYYGCDLSQSMIYKANKDKKFENIKYKVANGYIPFEEKFDFIYSIAVLAHILDDILLLKVIDNIYDNIYDNGYFICFEAIADTMRSGKTWTRRSEKDYIQMFEEKGFELIFQKYVSYTLFNMYEWFFLRKIERFFRGDGEVERRLAMNRSKLIIFLNEIIMKLSKLIKLPLKKKITGNTIFCFKKVSTLKN